MDSNESHHLTRGAVQASGRKLLIWSWPPPRGFLEIGKRSHALLTLTLSYSNSLPRSLSHSHTLLILTLPLTGEPCRPPYLEASRGVSWIPKYSLKSHAKVAFLVGLECSVVSYSKRSNPIIPQARPKGDPPEGSRKERTVNKFPKLYMSIARVHLVIIMLKL